MSELKVGVLGTGTVGNAIATRLVEVGHDVVMGSRDATNPKATAWAEATGGRAGTFTDAAEHGTLLFNATPGGISLDMLAGIGAAALSGKVLADVGNALDASGGMPPILSVANTDSLAEQIQRAYPDLRVVKALNTVNADVMVHPELVPGAHQTFVAGDDEPAKAVVTGVLQQFGWPATDILDLGGIRQARALEMYVPLWIALWQAKGTLQFNINVVRS